jgi:uncharacterized membrane protein YccC
MLRVVLPPLITAYVIFVAMVVLAVRRPATRPHRLGDGSASSRSRRVIGTMVGGYAAFLVIVLVFQVWIADEPDAFPSALWGGAFLCAITLVLAAGTSLLERQLKGDEAHRHERDRGDVHGPLYRTGS